jgi:TolB protein
MEIFILKMDDQSVTQITKGAADVEARQAAWSPDGSQIAYAVKRLGVYQIRMMNADGTGQKQIVRSGAQFSDYLPVWSPDGQLIIFNQRCAVTICSPYLMRISAADRSVEQGSKLQIGTPPVEDVGYSPDGFWLVYEGEESGANKDIFYMTVTGANRKRMTADKGLDFDPAWRPAGKSPIR